MNAVRGQELESLFPGNSEVAQRLRALDGSSTDLGPPERWPESLRVAVRICLTSRFPIMVCWGPRLLVLYNDAFIPLLGDAKHPRSLGRPAIDCWRELWNTVGPLLEGVQSTGQSIVSEPLPLLVARRLPREEAFVRFAMSPLLAADGCTVEGVFCQATETTEEVVGGRRLETLRKLGNKAPEVRSVLSACSAAAQILSENQPDIPFAAIYEVTESIGRARLVASTGLLQGQDLPAFASVEAGPEGPLPLSAALLTRQPQEIEVLAARTIPLPGVPFADPTTRAVVLPILATAGSLVGLLLIGMSPRRIFDAAYRTFFELIASHIGALIAGAKTQQLVVEASRLQRLATALDTADRQQLGAVLRESETRLTLELEAMTQLHALSTRLHSATDVYKALDDVLQSAISATQADFGCIHLYNPQFGLLEHVAQHGFNEEFVNHFRHISVDEGSASARAFRSAERVIIEDVQLDPSYAPHLHVAVACGYRAVQSTPLKSHSGSVIGMLTTQWSKVQRPSEHDEKVLDLYARHAADFIERLRSEEASRKQAERLGLLWEAAEVLLTTEEPDTMLRTLFGKLAPLLSLDSYTNYMLKEAGDTLKLESCSGIPDDAARKMARLPIGQGICGTAAAKRCPIVAVRIQQSFDPNMQMAKELGSRAVVCCPLLAGDRLLGTLSFGSRSRDQFDDDELEFLRTICRYVTVAEERLRLVWELREADRQKNEFLAMLGHELRNPLTPIRNAALLLEMSGSSGEHLDTVHDLIERQLQHLTRLVDDLLDVSRIMQGKITLRLEPTDLATVISRAVETAKPGIDAQCHSLKVALPSGRLRILGDPVRLSQVFANLLNNAAKYTPLGGNIVVEAMLEDGEVQVIVRDNGIGIAPELQPKIFDLFVQADQSLDRSQGGLGLGLTLVRRLVTLHSGSVRVKSDGLGCGSSFIVRLPVHNAPLLAAVNVPVPVPKRREAPGPGIRILVVDDNDDISQSLELVLSQLGHQVWVTGDGPSALVEAERHCPQLVLLDIGLPGMNGYQIAERLRLQPQMADALIVAMTGYGQEEDRRRSTMAGFNEHLVKPVDHAALSKLLASIGGAPRRKKSESGST